MSESLALVSGRGHRRLAVVCALLAGLSACATGQPPDAWLLELAVLDRVLASPDPAERAATVRELGEKREPWTALPEDIVLERLVAALLDADERVHDAAAEALCRMYPDDPTTRTLVLVASYRRAGAEPRQPSSRAGPTQSIH